MSDYYMDRDKYAKVYGVVSYLWGESKKNSVNTRKKTSRYEELYDKGNLWAMKGKKLDEAIEIIECDGKSMPLKNNNSFKRGFFAYIRSNPSDLASKGFLMADLPNELVDDEKFMDKYNKGVYRYGFRFGKNKKTTEQLPIGFKDDDKFINGYFEGLGYALGYDGVRIENLEDANLVKFKSFLIGYRNGIDDKAKLDENNKKKK